MKRYRDFQPTGFDPKGLALYDQQDWYVVPNCGRNRDSGPEESNFFVALKMLGGESETVEVHRFGHWACGWFEIIIVNPDSPQAAIAEDIERCLAEYPLLDDDDFSEREWNEASEYWYRLSLNDRMELCREHGASIFAARRDTIPDEITPSELIS
jgi:hypothetical protein